MKHSLHRFQLPDALIQVLVAARILKEAGHETAIYTSVVFRDKIERAEVRFFPLPEDADQGVRNFIT